MMRIKPGPSNKTSLSPTIIKKILVLDKVPFGYSLPLTITGTKDERYLEIWVLKYMLWRCFNMLSLKHTGLHSIFSPLHCTSKFE